jgi:hypothetical protein
MKLPELEAEIVRYSKVNGYAATQFSLIVCECGGSEFKLFSDDNEGGCGAECTKCGDGISVCDSADYMEDIVQNTCNCGHEALRLMTGSAFYQDSTDVRWIYVGASCPKCNLVGVYVDWNER